MNMACTPRKLVRWSADNEVNEFVYGSPYSDASSSDSINSTSTIQYINSQLIAHGFARGPGISVEGLSKEDMERLTKCLLGMLSQRMEDMSRAEDLSTKLRTLSYEHERLSSMHRTTEEQLASSERETNVFKSRLAAANKSIQASEAAHKASTAELQRTRTSLQSVRQTHAAELKRREKETEKMLERWQKIADAQTKLGATASGLKFKLTLANPLTDTRGSDTDGQGKDVLEDALEEAQMARKELIEENTSLKSIVLSAANEIARMARTIRLKVDSAADGDEQCPQQKLTFSDIFSIPAPESASDKIIELLSSFRAAINQIGNDADMDAEPASVEVPSPNQARKSKDESKEIQRLQNTIIDLRRQLEQAQTQKQTSTYSDQAQEIIRKFVDDDNEKAHVQERRVLEKIRKELDHARKKVDEAALTLRDEKEAMEEERQAFFREQHLWRSRMGILHDDEEEEPKPTTDLAAYFDAPAKPLDIPTAFASPKSTRKPKRAKSPSKSAAVTDASPRKQLGKSSVFAVGKIKAAKKAHGGGGTAKKAKPSGRGGGGGLTLGASPARQRVIPSMETEVVASPPAPLLSTAASAQSLIVTDAFVLPPPTPLTSIPPEEDILSSLGRVTAPDFGAQFTSSEEGEQNAYLGPEPGPSNVPAKAKEKKPFPIAKPLAQRMIHAYSPARPSPLSRILNLSKSPSVRSDGGSELGDDGAIQSGEEGDEPLPPTMTLDELGVGTESDGDADEDTGPAEESPLREKNIRLSKSRKGARPPAAAARGAGAAAAVTKDKLRNARADRDKENGTLRAGKTGAGTRTAKATAVPAAKPLGAGPGRGGARRVPIGSVDAAPIGRTGWK